MCISFVARAGTSALIQFPGRVVPLVKVLALLVLLELVCFAGPVPGSWTPIFKGVDHAVGTNNPSVSGNFAERQVVHCIRVDLADPDVRLFTTPRASSYVAESRETLTQSVPNFLKQNKLQVACDANFYDANPGGADPSSEGLSCEVYGLQICTGTVVSAMTTVDAASNPRFASLLFTTNNQPSCAFANRPPGTNTTGIYTATTGFYPIVSNGVNIGAASITSYPDPAMHLAQPRTVFGISQDVRYLLLMTIDGRQNGYSEGALDSEAAYWMLQFGGWNAINMDGGGSTAMYMSDSAGNPVAVNRSSYLLAAGRERYVGSHLGVYARPSPGFINDVQALPDDTAATVTWTTTAPASSQVRYGLTTNLGLTTALLPALVTNHAVLLPGLTPGTGYYFRILSAVGGTQYASSNFFLITTNYQVTNAVFDLANSWRFHTANLDGVGWKAIAYDDSAWDGGGPGLLWVDSRGPNYMGDIPVPLLTEMPLNASTGYPYRTYYLRTHILFTNAVAGAGLLAQVYLDDGAVFYLNGGEIYRLFMAAYPTVIANSTLSTGYGCTGGDASCPIDFFLPPSALTNLVPGDNVLAVEVHNYNAASPDITFGMSLAITQPYSTSPRLSIVSSNGMLTLVWSRGGFTLQQANDPAGPWADVPGPVVSSPFQLPATGAAQYYRLKK